MNTHVFGRKPTFIPDPYDVQENKFLCILCYIGFLFVIPLVAKPQSRYVKYHANQGLLLFLFEIAVGFVTSMFSLVFGIIHLGFIAGIVNLALSALSLFFMVYGIIATCEGHIKPLPVLGDLFVAIRY
ncbi:MAG: hypothetical protein ACOX6U_05760 [Oscillospiraceae bacterium]|jgi:uncharacterized membrane protein